MKAGVRQRFAFVLALMIAALQVGDIVSTDYNMRARSDIIEGNPVARYLMDQLGISFWWVPKIVLIWVVVGTVVALTRISYFTLLVMATLTVYYGLFVANNIFHFELLDNVVAAVARWSL